MTIIHLQIAVTFIPPNDFKNETGSVETFDVLIESLFNPELNKDRCGSELRVKLEYGLVLEIIEKNPYPFKYIFAEARVEYIFAEGYSDAVV